MAELTQDFIDRLEALERRFNEHLGPQPGATSLNQPHVGVPYLSNGVVPISKLPTGTDSDEVALGNHIHASGFYL